jgi:hypothetical protein
MARWIVRAWMATALLVGAAVPLSAGEWAALFRRQAAAPPRTVHRIGHEGQYEFDLGNVPTFRYGYFGAHGRPINSWSTDQYRTYKQWSLRPGW